MALITAQQIKDRVDNRDLDTKLFTDELIELAENKHLRPILTPDLYDALVADPSSYTSLLAAVLDPLAWFVYYEIMLIYYISVTEQGFKFNRTKDQDNVGSDHYKSLKKWAYQNAMSYYDALIENIDDNNYDAFDSDKQLNKKIIGGILI